MSCDPSQNVQQWLRIILVCILYWYLIAWKSTVLALGTVVWRSHTLSKGERVWSAYIPFSHEIGLDRQQIYARRDNYMRACVIQPKSNHTPLQRNARANHLSPSLSTLVTPPRLASIGSWHNALITDILISTETIDERKIKALQLDTCLQL